MHNEQSSVSTSPSESQRDSELSEADYLAREVADARAALTESLAGLKLGVTNSTDIRQWVKYYPWASLAQPRQPALRLLRRSRPPRGSL